MGLQEVKQEIINKAKKKASAIIKEGNKEAKAIIAHAEDQVNEYKAKMDKDKRKACMGLEKIQIAAANSEAKKLELDAKRDAIESAFVEAKEKILQRGSEKKKAHLLQLLKKAKNELQVETVYCNAKDKQFIGDANVVEGDMEGGIIAENKDETIRVDYRVETLLESIKERELHAIAEILFKK